MNNKNVLKKAIGILAFAAFWLTVWQLASMLIGDDLRIFLPAPLTVVKRLFRLLPTAEFQSAVGKSLLRIFAGFLIGITLGLLLGAATALFKPADIIISPMMSVIRAVPVVSFIVLAYLFIQIETLPVFISALMVMPLMWQAVHIGISKPNRELTEMCRAFRIGKVKTLIFVKLPFAAPSLISTAINSLGLAWKSGVAAEVLCSPAVSIGHIITMAKNNLEYGDLYAVTLTVVILSLVLETALMSAFRHSPLGKSEDGTARRRVSK